ncbi:aldo/keto reductase, partial [Candidatus Sumerlaeota bacterium]|nr:aldo/keto reductase [Candidatus Sumerlaeota bacterium]
MVGKDFTRREFIHDSAAASAAVAAAGLTAGCARGVAIREMADVTKTRSYNENMEYRRLGKTGLMVSAISLGGHWKKLPYKPGTAEFNKNRADVISACLDHGINYVDACAGGEVMAYADAVRGRREEIYFGYSWYEWEMRFAEWQTENKLLEGFDKGLRQAKLNYVDLWRITCYWQPKTNHTTAHEEAIVGALNKARKAGKVRFCGISTHKHDWAIRMMEKYP